LALSLRGVGSQKNRFSTIFPVGVRNAVRLAADANALLSAVIGGRARLIIERKEVREILTTEATLAEVQEYALVLAKKKRLDSDIVLLAIATLPIKVVDRNEYAKRLPEALKIIGSRDPDDAELLALALHLGIPIWSNDRDFEELGVELFSTEELLRQLGIID
jgi:predicted nucleic acid-binding protein